VHEAGLDIAHSHHHHHAAYLLENADLAGFSVGEQRRLAFLVGGHRRKIRPEVLEGLERGWESRLPLLLVLLRISVLLHRSRVPEDLPPLAVKAAAGKVKLRFPTGWLEAHPLTQADLETEARYLSALDVKLSFR